MLLCIGIWALTSSFPSSASQQTTGKKMPLSQSHISLYCYTTGMNCLLIVGGGGMLISIPLASRAITQMRHIQHLWITIGHMYWLGITYSCFACSVCTFHIFVLLYCFGTLLYYFIGYLYTKTNQRLKLLKHVCLCRCTYISLGFNVNIIVWIM